MGHVPKLWIFLGKQENIHKQNFDFLIIRISKKAFCSKLHFLQPVTRTANLCSSDILKNAILVKTEVLRILAPEVQKEGLFCTAKGIFLLKNVYYIKKHFKVINFRTKFLEWEGIWSIFKYYLKSILFQLK